MACQIAHRSTACVMSTSCLQSGPPIIDRSLSQITINCMNSLRIFAFILCAIILVKSMHCTVVETVRLCNTNNPSQPEEGCDSGCLCKGAIFVEPVQVETDQFVDWFCLIGTSADKTNGHIELGARNNFAHYLIAMDEAQIFGRKQRARISSFTL